MRMRIRHRSITDIIILLMFMFASLDLFQISGKTFFFYIGLVFIVCSIVNKGKLKILKDPLIIAIFAEFFISGIFAQFSGLNSELKKTAIIMPILVMPIFLEAGIFEGLIKRNESILQVILKGVRLACIIQFIYIPVQYLLYHFAGIDLNKEIFVNALGFVKSASFIRDWVWYPSGITWHSAIVAPLMVIGIVLFDNVYLRMLIILDAFICGSSTAIVGVTLTFIMLIFFKLTKGAIKLKKYALYSIMGIIITIAVIFLSTDLWSIVFDKFNYIFIRLFGTVKDSSTSAHILYVYNYPTFLKEGSLIQILFGKGYACSGSVFSSMYGGTWSVESEIMDRLYSLGLVGFILYNTFLLKIVVKGNKIDKRYGIIIIAIFVEGFGYNVQWDYILLIELILYICVKHKINIFDYVKFDKKYI